MTPINLSRRDFLATSATAAAGMAMGCAPGMHGIVASAALTSAAADAQGRELALLAMDTARAAGAEYVALS